MNWLEGITTKTAIVLLGAFIVLGGFALALPSSGIMGTADTSPSLVSSNTTYPVGQNYSSYHLSQVVSNGMAGYGRNSPVDGTQIIQTTTSMSTGPARGADSTAVPTNSTLGAGSLIEFSSSIWIESANPQQAAAGVVALAYTVGGYVAYQSTNSISAYVVIRVPAAEYQTVQTQIRALGNVTNLVSNSNDVRVQYTDLNATLASLRTEQTALLRLLNQSTTISTTLSIETQLQGVNQQINDIESQILQTRTLVDFSTINVTVSKTAQKAPLTMTLVATPRNGTAPLSVTFNAIVKGGAQPYVVNYNFGDGMADQGQILIHTYYASGDFKVSVSVTDQNGTVATGTASIHVAAPPSQYGAVNFPATIANLFVSVVEGIAEVAVVALPLAAVGAAVILPLRRRSRVQKTVRQEQ